MIYILIGIVGLIIGIRRKEMFFYIWLLTMVCIATYVVVSFISSPIMIDKSTTEFDSWSINSKEKEFSYSLSDKNKTTILKLDLSKTKNINIKSGNDNKVVKTTKIQHKLNTYLFLITDDVHYDVTVK